MPRAAVTPERIFANLGLVEKLTLAGCLFVASDADENDLVTGQTSYAATTPTWLLDVPKGTTAIPLYVNLAQGGSVAGGDVNIHISIDNVARFTSGTAEKAFNFRRKTPKCGLYSTVTAAAGYGINLFTATVGADISPAEGAVQGPYWAAEVPHFIEGPGAFMVYTYAGTTGPSWGWSIGWLELPTASLPKLEF